MRKFLLGAAGVAAFGFFAAPAWATTEDGCSVSGSGSSTSYSNCGSSPTAASPAKTDGESTRSSIGTISAAVGNRVSGALKSGGGAKTAMVEQTGVSAGDGAVNQALWASVGASTLSNTVPGAAYSGTLSNQTAGYDMVLNGATVVGLSVFHEGDVFSTDFNSGSIDADVWWAAPYVGHDFGQGSTMDAMVGLAYVNGEAKRAGGNAYGSYEGYRMMAAINGRHNWDLGGNWFVRGDLGLMGAFSHTASYDEKGAAGQHQAASNSHLIQAKAGGRASYLWGAVEPYASAYYAYDLVADYVGDSGVAPGGSDDADEFQFYAGMDWYPTDTESVGVEVSKIVGRDRSDSMGVMMNARLRF